MLQPLAADRCSRFGWFLLRDGGHAGEVAETGAWVVGEDAAAGVPGVSGDDEIVCPTSSAGASHVIKNIVIVGGTGVVSTAVQDSLSGLGVTGVSRVAGADRYATSAAIATKYASLFSSGVSVATGTGFADALTGGVLSAKQKMPLLLLNPATGSTQNTGGLSSTNVTVYGGTGALPDTAAQSVESTLSGSSTPSTPTAVVAGTVTVAGNATVGSTLTANPGTWSPSSVALSYQWSRAAAGTTTYTSISGATNAAYTVTPMDMGYTLQVTVTGTLAGYQAASKTSAPTVTVPQTTGTLSIAAGVGVQPIPGPATSSPVTLPGDIAVDAQGNFYIADQAGYVEKVTPEGTLSIVAGDGQGGTNGTVRKPIPGPALDSPMFPFGVAVDTEGNIYIADNHSYVEKVDASTGILSIVAGNGTFGSPISGPATNSPVNPVGIAVDSRGNLYIGDQSGYVEKVNLATGILSIVAGNGESGTPLEGPATSSPVGGENRLAVDSSGDTLYISGGGNVVDKIDLVTGVLSIIAGTGKSGTPVSGPALDSPMNPGGIALDSSGNLYIADSGIYVVKINLSTGILSIIAGNGSSGNSVPGQATNSPLNAGGVAVDSAGSLYVAGSSSRQIYKVTSAGILSVVAGVGTAPIPGTATGSPMAPSGVAVDASGNLYIVDPGNNVVEKVTTAGQLLIVAGNGVSGTPVAGSALDSPMYPRDIAVDSSGNMYIMDAGGYVDKVTPAGNLTVIAGNGKYGAPVPGIATDSPLANPTGLAVDSEGNVYISTQWDYVVKVTASGQLTIAAGNGDSGAPISGTASASPMQPIGVAVDLTGNLYIADSSGYVEKVTPAGQLSVVAGNGTTGSPVSGVATSSSIQALGVATDSAGNLYITDSSGYVERVTSTGVLSVVAGNGAPTFPVPGPVADSSLAGAYDIAVDFSGNIYVSDPGVGSVYKISW